MTTSLPNKGNPYGYRAIVAVQVAVLMVVMLGFAALVVDVGALYNARSDLQRAADAAALAGASAYTTDEMMEVRMQSGGADALAQVLAYVNGRTTSFSELNPSIGTSVTHVLPNDIRSGYLNLNNPTNPIQTNPQPKDFNAVGVIVRRQAGGGEGSNQPVDLYFAPVLGFLFGETAARAVAVFDDRFSGYTFGAGGAGGLPFTIHEDAFQSELDAGGDSYGYDEAGDVVYDGADGVREVRLYPYPLSGNGYVEGDGNFGVLNIGTGNQGVDALRVQIQNGVTPEDMEMEIGTSEPTFHDDAGNPVTYDITGSPGLDAGLAAAIESIEGQVVAFFLHNDVILSGSNAIYTITEIRFGRVMDIRLIGAPDTRGLFIQPVSYTGGGVQIDPEAPSSGGLVGRLVLAQ